MLFLLFQLGRDRYVLDTAQVVGIVPSVGLKAVPQAPPEVAGLLDHHGVPVPVIDVSRALLGRPSRAALSTRLVLVGGKERRLLGLILEGATGTIRRDPAEFTEGGVTVEGVPCLGPVASAPDGVGFIQWVEPMKLLSEAARTALFRQVDEMSEMEPRVP